jgi:methylene-tetrahydromethanopterin dehydrogenase
VERKNLLYLVSSDSLVSPFDINMAYDAGFDAVIPYAGVEVSAVTGLTQDVMFSRGPKGARHSAIFFAGSDLTAAEAMLRAARAALFDPFRIGLMIDPRGGYTTAAAMLAKVQQVARARGIGELDGRRVLVAAGTGGVGRAAAAMAARAGARVVLTSRWQERLEPAAREISALFQASIETRAAPGESELAALARDSDVVLATGKAGVQLLSRDTIASLRGPKILADVNAVPPAGIEGLKPADDGTELAPGIAALGPLAIGGLKIQVEATLLKDLLAPQTGPVLDSRAAQQRAADLLASR